MRERTDDEHRRLREKYHILVEGEDKSSVNANANTIVAQWLRDFEAALAKKPLELSNLFAEDSWLKDALTLATACSQSPDLCSASSSRRGNQA